ncbi:MAG TPA: ionic transporter y4hA [Bacteroidia bacterium]|nr:ionic transporter y4hA [Bacteroidia bacterium]OQA45917.1 MAG: Sodium/proton antiporter ChaA [Bacteroidetes bacterium ADurb.Bin302]MBP7714309.1 ionic transporter y4hA [Bacteroidia bacterium]MBP8668968.1 ionic transporter y4hA [Bacteroidia bacterium]HOZ82160.1 ionic transporter y4hA [Bacteroidia bacterium]
MQKIVKLYEWTTSLPIITCLLYFSGLLDNNIVLQILAGILLLFCVMSAVHHSEIVAHRVGEPYGTIILAVSITIIEVAIIISLMMTGGKEYASFARDTVYAAVMLILNGIIGLSLFLGGRKYHTQTFSPHSVKIALVALVSIVTFTMILPTFTSSIIGPYYTERQLLFEIIACLIIYIAFIAAQTIRYREYFITEANPDVEVTHNNISNSSFIISLIFLMICLVIVVLLAKSLSNPIENLLTSYGLPRSLVGIVIAAVILLPEGIAAVSSARKNKLQNSLNLALGSALASIGLTIPAVSLASYIFDLPLILGLELLPIILLAISIFTVMLSLIGGRSNIVYGVVLLVNLFAYVFLTINP